MQPPVDPPAATTALSRWLPYAIASVALLAGLVILLLGPFSPPMVNVVVGALLLVVAVGSVLHLVVRHSGPGERGPDF